MDPLRHRGVSRPGRLHRADLRQHADGPGRVRHADRRADGYKIAYYAPQPRAVVEVVDFDNYDKVVDYGKTAACMLTTLTKEFFVPRFLERDEGERETPSAKYPWDGVSGVQPFRGFAATTTVGVY